MLGGKYYTLHACCHKGFGPLLAIKTCGVKYLRVGVAISPLAVAKGIEAEVYKGVGLHALPINLLLFRQRQQGLGSLHIVFRKNRSCCHHCTSDSR